MKTLYAAALCAAFTTAASAEATPASYFDVFYAPDAKLKITDTDPSTGGSASFDGHGYGVRTNVHLGSALVLEGEYQKSKLTYNVPFFGEYKTDLEDARVGVGFANDAGSGLFVQWHNIKLSDDYGSEDSLPGWGLHGRWAGSPTPQFHVYGDLGYQRFKDDDTKITGPEYSAGAVYDVGTAGIFVDYRVADLKTDDNYEVKLKFSGPRIGLRLRF